VGVLTVDYSGLKRDKSFWSNLVKINIPNLIKDVLKPNNNYDKFNAIFYDVIATKSLKNFTDEIKKWYETNDHLDKYGYRRKNVSKYK